MRRGPVPIDGAVGAYALLSTRHTRYPLAPLELLRIVFVALMVILTWAARFSAPAWLLPAAAVIGGHPILRETREAILQRRMTMALSMTVALVAAAAIPLRRPVFRSALSRRTPRSGAPSRLDKM